MVGKVRLSSTTWARAAGTSGACCRSLSACSDRSTGKCSTGGRSTSPRSPLSSSPAGVMRFAYR
eukprot:4684466-Pyramimonas_sp.AAC.1